MSVINANPLMLGDAGYNIQRSLRFRSSASAYLSRTFGTPTDSLKYTVSGWVKRGKLGISQAFFPSKYTSSTNYGLVYFNASDQIVVSVAFSGSAGSLTTSAVFRDPSAWYHIVVVYDSANATAANRCIIYVNGVSQTLTGTTIPLNLTSYVNTATTIYIGGDLTATDYLDGYLAEVNFIDGQALTPSSFGQTDAVTGVWQPKKYSGSYGTNGFYLPFSNNTSATTLAYDFSGNGNNWTANNISTTAGATYDSMTDVPTLTSATAANFCTLNPTAQGQFSNSYSSTPASATGAALTQGNLYATGANAGTGAYGAWVGTMPLNDGKWYWESTLIAEPTADFSFCGIVRYDNGTTNTPYFPNNGSYTVNDVLGFTWDDTAKELKWYKNGTLQATLVTGATGSYLPWVGLANANVMAFNFGQRPFQYTPPTGFKALNTFNLPDPVIKKPNQYMDATLWTGDQSARTITNSGNFQPDLVWTKSRSDAENHRLHDSVRGGNGAVLYELNSNLTEADGTDTLVSGMVSNGFTIASGANSPNITGRTYVGWQWKKGATPGFDIVAYSGTSTNRTEAHNLGVAPKMLIVKQRNGTAPWAVYHVNAPSGLYLNQTSAQDGTQYAGLWNSTSPTSSVFSLGTSNATNGTGGTYVAYLFAEIPGFSKFGSYTGNGSTDGPFVYCGFRPKYVMWKRTDRSGDDWWTYDAARNTYNVASNGLRPNLSAVEYSAATIDLLSNGFKLKSTAGDQNGSGGTYIYAAFAENPFKYSLAR